jgi:hypothetical protein
MTSIQKNILYLNACNITTTFEVFTGVLKECKVKIEEPDILMAIAEVNMSLHKLITAIKEVEPVNP